MFGSSPSRASVLGCVLSAAGALLWPAPSALGANEELLQRVWEAAEAHSEWLTSDGRQGRRLNLAELWEPQEQWVLTNGASGDQADLSDAHLRDANLSKAFLSGVNLSGALLQGANLSGASLRGANLTGANLRKADLSGASLSEADLRGAWLLEANLSRADLVGANLDNALLGSADLRSANLYGAHLSEADLSYADLREANLSWDDLTGINLRWADLRKAQLVRANLVLTKLTGANLRAADLTHADLSAADLTDADLADATLVHTNLSGATVVHTDLAAKAFRGIDLRAATFEPATAPPPEAISDIHGLQTVRVTPKHHTGLVLFRASLESAGLRAPEREATFLIERSKAQAAPRFERVAKTILFDWTSAYGLHPGRALWILGAVIGLFAIVYWLPILGLGRARVVRVWPKERLVAASETSFELADSARVEPLVSGPIRGLGLALYFSLLSAFHIGWRELNVGTWIARVQPEEYVLRATGWVRVVSGFQSVVSVYLLGLAILTYFGRPFE
jgi:uncharacterized protein YjbI with pentapeptide repeats